jgi:hypothetical protein
MIVLNQIQPVRFKKCGPGLIFEHGDMVYIKTSHGYAVCLNDGEVVRFKEDPEVMPVMDGVALVVINNTRGKNQVI